MNESQQIQLSDLNHLLNEKRECLVRKLQNINNIIERENITNPKCDVKVNLEQKNIILNELIQITRMKIHFFQNLEIIKKKKKSA